MIPKAALFDLDGTLVDTRQYHIQSWKTLFERHGCAVSYEDLLSAFGRTSPATIRSVMTDETDEDTILALAHEKEKLYREMIRDKLTLVPGAKELMMNLRQAGYAIALATSAPPENVDLVLRRLRIGPLFDLIVGEEDIAHSKPDPEIFALAAHRLGVHPHRCVVFEDSPSGVQAAVAAQMTCIAVTTGYRQSELPGASLWIQDFNAIDVPTIEDLIAKD